MGNTDWCRVVDEGGSTDWCREYRVAEIKRRPVLSRGVSSLEEGAVLIGVG